MGEEFLRSTFQGLAVVTIFSVAYVLLRNPCDLFSTLFPLIYTASVWQVLKGNFDRRYVSKLRKQNSIEN